MGAEDKTRLGYRSYLALGILSGLVATVLVPLVFGLLSVFCGLQIFRKFDERVGIVVAVWGGLGIVVGILVAL